MNSNVVGSDIETSSTNGDSLEVPQTSGNPIEPDDTNTVDAMYHTAERCSENANADGFDIVIEPLEVNIHNRQIPHKGFSIIDDSSKKGYVVYQIDGDSNVYYRPIDEFRQLIADIIDDVPGRSVDSFRYEYSKTDEPLEGVPSTDTDDCIFIVYSIFSSMCGHNYSDHDSDMEVELIDDDAVNENIKIRRHTKLSTDGIAANSILYHDAKYGTPDENAFKQEIEDKQKKDGTMGAIDNMQQQESEDTWKMKLPNVHNVSEMNESYNVPKINDAKLEDIIYEPFDRVVVKIDNTNMKGVVISIYDNTDGTQLVTVMVQGHTFEVSPKELRPDTDYLLNTRWGNCDPRGEYDALDLNPETWLNNKVKNDDYDYSKDYKDLNNRSVECDIVVNGFRLNWQKEYANLQDIKESKQMIRVVNESGYEEQWDPNSLQFNEWPWAVVVSDEETTDENGDTVDDDEPIRKIRINPTSYINAKDDDMVECIVNDKRTEMPKRNIKIIS